MATNNGRVTIQLLKQKSREFDIESIFILDLRQLDLSSNRQTLSCCQKRQLTLSNIDDLGNIGECTSLEKLNLSRNRIQKLYALSSLLNLTWLDLSANMIQYVDGLQTCEKLKYLNLAGNLIQNVESLNCLFGLENLESLRLHDRVLEVSNPVCRSCTYKYEIRQNLPQLKELDGERLSGKGSDLFELLSSIGDTVTGNSRPRSAASVFRVSPLEGIPDGYFHVAENEFQDDVETLDAEKELLDLLTECRHMHHDIQSKHNVT